MIQRRKFLTGVVGLICAPAIVRASSIMPVSSWVEPNRRWFLPADRLPESGATGGSHFIVAGYPDFSDPLIWRWFTG